MQSRTLRSASALLLLVASSSAAAAPQNELSIHLSTLGTPDADYDMFSENANLTSVSLRGGWGFHENISLIGDLSRSRSVSDVYAYGSEDWEEVLIFRSGLTTYQLGLGLKGRIPIANLPWLAGYAVGQGVAMTSTVRLDDEPDQEDNPNELQYRAMAPGFRVAGGVELLPLRVGFEGRLFTNLEVGYGLVGALNYRDAEAETVGEDTALIGDLKFRGVYFAWGMGWRF